MPLQLNMQKSAEKLKLNLQKAGILTPPEVEIAFDLDVSGSYEDEHLDGSTSALMARMVPWGLVFDPDRKLDVFTFSSGNDNAVYVGDINERNYDDYVRMNIVRKVKGWNGGTDYAHVLRKNLEYFGWIAPSAGEAKQPKSVFGSLFGKKPVATPSAPLAQKKSLVIFNTDGSSGDERETEALLSEMEQKGYKMYVLFLAYANGGANFRFLERMGDKFSNTGLHVIRRLKDFTEATDEQLNEWLITDELVQWLKS